MKRCKDCKPKTIPVFPIWDEKAKHWPEAKKSQKLKELCCSMNKQKKKLNWGLIFVIWLTLALWLGIIWLIFKWVM